MLIQFDKYSVYLHILKELPCTHIFWSYGKVIHSIYEFMTYRYLQLSYADSNIMAICKYYLKLCYMGACSPVVHLHNIIINDINT